MSHSPNLDSTGSEGDGEWHLPEKAKGCAVWAFVSGLAEATALAFEVASRLAVLRWYPLLVQVLGVASGTDSVGESGVSPRSADPIPGLFPSRRE